MWHAAALLLCQIAAAPLAGALDCYTCGGLTSDRPASSCAEFRNALTWSLFTVSCPDDQLCVKMVSLYYGEEDREFRGCAHRETSYGLRHPIACSRSNTSESQTEFCFCDTRFCNGAPAGRRPPAVGALLAAVALAAAVAGLHPVR